MIGWLGDEMWRDDQKRLSHAQPPSADHPWGADFMENSGMCPLGGPLRLMIKAYITLASIIIPVVSGL